VVVFCDILIFVEGTVPCAVIDLEDLDVHNSGKPSVMTKPSLSNPPRDLFPRVCSVLFCVFLMISNAGTISYAKQPRDDLFGVSFPSSEKGWVCGRWGAIFQSGDGGKTWERQKSGTDLTLSAVCFVDERHGWAVGEEGIIIHTEDGGETWAEQKCPVPYFLLDVYFTDQQNGWIVTERTTILHTADGGTTWAVQFKDQDYFLKAVSFCDSLHGWAVGEYGFIYHTGDGGKTWEHQAGRFGWDEETGEIVGGIYLFDVIAIDPNTAWAVGIDGYVTRTSDGGQTWKRVTVDISPTHLLGITSDGKQGFLICGTGTLLVSADGGQTFSPLRGDPVITYGWLNSAMISPDGKMIAVGKEGWVYVTSDRGESWNRIATQ
jgi:photosystem II stability/assembly factor-like uncharacterized protein